MGLITRAILYARHYHYQDKAQWPDADSLLMAAMDHPYWKEFDTLWQLYESLPVACGPGWRYLAYRNRKNYIRLKRPRLTIADAIAHPLNVHNVFLLARADWRSASPGIDRGALDVATEDGDFDAQLKKILVLSDAWMQRGTYHLQANCLDPWTFCRTLQVIHHACPPEDLQTGLLPHLLAIQQSQQAPWGSTREDETRLSASKEGLSAEDRRLRINIDEIDEATRRRDTWI